jgi:dTDP-4-dehydrorhamnose 3,5-epimerase
MKITETEIPGLLIIEPMVFSDGRGYFFESYNERLFRERGLDFDFVQDNESRSVRNVIRGLHYQLSPFSQTKLLRVLEGSIFDVAVDLRKDSPSYGKWLGIEISARNRLQVLIPRGCAHGFSVLSRAATVHYKCDEYYNPQYERGILYSDSTLSIGWKIKGGKEIISPKDMNAPLFSEADNNFIFGKI